MKPTEQDLAAGTTDKQRISQLESELAKSQEALTLKTSQHDCLRAYLKRCWMRFGGEPVPETTDPENV